MNCKDSKNIEQLAETFKALAHPIRLKIAIGLSQKKDCNVSKMVQKLEISQSSVSQHLKILKNSGVVKSERRGNEICYSLANDCIKKVLSCMGENQND